MVHIRTFTTTPIVGGRLEPQGLQADRSRSGPGTASRQHHISGSKSYNEEIITPWAGGADITRYALSVYCLYYSSSLRHAINV